MLGVHACLRTFEKDRGDGVSNGLQSYEIATAWLGNR